MNRTAVPRLLGVATIAYSLAVAARPEVLLKPTGLATGLGDDGLRATARLVALRDLASGLAMVFAPNTQALRLAIAVRVGADVADTAVLGTALRGKPEWGNTVAVTGGFGLICAASALATV